MTCFDGYQRLRFDEGVAFDDDLVEMQDAFFPDGPFGIFLPLAEVVDDHAV